MAVTIEESEAPRVNGLDVSALAGVVEQVTRDPKTGVVEFRVRSRWRGRTRSEHRVDGYELGGRRIERPFRMMADSPTELLGENTAPNPQEMLMAALNACLMVGYVAAAAARGIALEKLEIETCGELDLRGFLAVDASVPAGYESIRYVVRIKGDGTPAQLREIHDVVCQTSPNYFNVAQPVGIEARLEVES